MSAASIKAKAARRRKSGKGPKNTAYTTASGQSVRIKDGVKTYSDRPLKVRGKGGISISGESYSRNKGGTGYAPITPDALEKQDVYQPPAAPQAVDLTGQSNQINAMLAGAMGGTYDPATGFTTPAATETTGEQSATDLFKSYLGTEEQLKANVPSQEQLTREMQAELRPKENLVNKLQNQITSITTDRDAAQLGLEGQGRGITETIIGGQQARVGREAAIKALPIQAQLAAAQGDLDSARSYLGQLYQARSADAQAEYQYKSSLAKSIYSFLDTQQQRRVDAATKANDRAFGVEQNNLAYQRQLGLQALEYGQQGLISGITSIDPSSPTFEQDIAAFTSRLRKPVVATGSAGAPTIKSINGVDMQWDAATGTWVEPSTGQSAPRQTQQILNNRKQIDLISNIATNPAIDSTVGTTIFSRSGKGVKGFLGRVISGGAAGGAAGAAAGLPFAGVGAIPGAIAGAVIGGTAAGLQGSKDVFTGDKQNLIGDVSQLTAKLTNQELINAKASGATYGALGVKEQQLLENAATKINNWGIHVDNDPEKPVIGYNASEKDFNDELDLIKYYTVLDSLLKGDDPASLGVVIQPDGTYWFPNRNGSFSQLQ